MNFGTVSFEMNKGQKRSAVNLTEEIKEGEESRERNPVLKEALTPILNLMKIFGLYFECARNAPDHEKIKRYVIFFVCQFMFLLLLTAFIKSFVCKYPIL